MDNSYYGFVANVVNEAVGHRSCLDHVFVTSDLRRYIQNYDVLLMANNFSDHRPISITFFLKSTVKNVDMYLLNAIHCDGITVIYVHIHIKYKQ